MLIGAFGGLGSGKTLILASYCCHVANNPKYEVYTNFIVKHPRITVVEPIDLLNINPKTEKVLLGLDEVYSWLDSRMSQTKVNRFLSWIILQSRKRNMDIFYNAQLGSSVDLRLRDLTDIVIYCMRTSLNPKADFIYIVELNLGWKVKRAKFLLPYNKAKRFFKYFDTREIVEPIEIERLKQELLKLRKKRKS